MDWYVYMVRCKDNSLYTGITTCIKRRIKEHNCSKKGSKYCRSRRPVKLAYLTKVASKSIALKHEHKIKNASKYEKETLCDAYLWKVTHYGCWTEMVKSICN